MIPSREIDHGSGPHEQRNDRVCADFIKSLHADLRLEAQNNIDDSEQIWDNHVKDGKTITIWCQNTNYHMSKL